MNFDEMVIKTDFETLILKMHLSEISLLFTKPFMPLLELEEQQSNFKENVQNFVKLWLKSLTLKCVTFYLLSGVFFIPLDIWWFDCFYLSGNSPHAFVLVLFFGLKSQPIRSGAGGDDDGMS